MNILGLNSRMWKEFFKFKNHVEIKRNRSWKSGDCFQVRGVCVCNSFSVGPMGANNYFIVEAWLIYNRVDKMWVPVIVEVIPVNQEVACKFMFITFLFSPHLQCICEVLFCDSHTCVHTHPRHTMILQLSFCRCSFFLILIAVTLVPPVSDQARS